MDKEEIPSSKQDESKVSVRSNGKASGNVALGGTLAKKEVKTKRRKKRNFWKEVRLTIKEIRPEVWVAIIGAITTIIVALINSQAIIGWVFKPTQTPTFTPTATVTITNTPTLTFTTTSTLTASPTVTDMPTASVTPSVTIEPSKTINVFVVLVANRNTGRPPLNIRLDARDSYLLEPNGTRLSCRGGPCRYTWVVYSGGQQIAKSDDDSSGTFEYTFGKKGTYTVTVFVCRGRDRIDCAGSGTQIVVSN